MKSLLSPKELAEAIGVSESSLRRWADDGQLTVTRTVGGHRRIPIGEAIRFIRQSGATVVRPHILGLGEVEAAAPGGQGDQTAGDAMALAEATLLEALKKGDGPLARGTIFNQYLRGVPLAQIFDGPVTKAMAHLGELWKHSPQGIVIEHRAVDICLQTIGQLHAMLPPHREQRPVALGGAPEDDPYILPSLMAGTVLADLGFADHNLGPDLPTDALLSAVDHYHPELVWLSLSSPLNPDHLRRQVTTIAEHLARSGAFLVVGGRRLTPDLVRGLDNVQPVASMGELAAFARGVLTTWRSVQTGSANAG